MYKGINFTTPDNYAAVKHLVVNKNVDFIELMVDNFLHLDPNQFLDEFGSDTPYSFHIMSSMPFDQELSDLKTLGAKIRKFVEILKPIYVSDHLAHFKTNGKFLPKTIEVDYTKKEEYIQKIALWSDILESKIYFENFPSLGPQGLGELVTT
tara:strand:- start:24 stop:479 length:456 start_codon:yes stop_codon:yes gene_type:complete